MGKKKFFLETYGCQMNEYDSHLVESMLLQEGFQKAESEQEADIVIINTCSVRQKAEERALGRIRSISSSDKLKEIAVIGCMAQRLGDKLLRENKQVKYVLGTDQFPNISRILQESHSSKVVDISCRETPFDYQLDTSKDSLSSYVTIMRGCNNYCTYCIVPYVRGRERYRPPERVLEEVKRMQDAGNMEIWLLGQNVNSYDYQGLKFPELLSKVSVSTGIPRIRFLTSHPKDFSLELIDVMASKTNICNSIHLPLQSGSDSVLEKMNRKYTASQYLDKVDALRKSIPEIVITTDVIVGFPGESREDYDRTKALMEEVGFDSAFMFRYSVRSGTKAEEFGDEVSEEEKLSRLDELIRFQKRISERKMQNFENSVQSVLLEKISSRNDQDALGKSDGGINVVVKNASAKIGKIVKVRINSSTYTTLIGELID